MNALPPPPRALDHLAATFCDLVSAFLLFLVSPVLGSLLWWGYRFYCHRRDGRTLGKRLLGVQLIDKHSFAVPSTKQLLARDVPFFAAEVIMLLPFLDVQSLKPYENAGAVFYLVVCLASFITLCLPKTRGRTLYDLWAGTVVVNLRAADLYHVQTSANQA